MSSKLALITFLTDGGGGAVDPGFGVRPPVDPGYGHPGYGGGHPGNALPGGGYITTLPVFPFDPTIDNSLPGNQPGVDNSLPGSSARPDNELPRPGKRYVVKWLACQGLILVPDNELPATPEPK